jgi:type IV secretion system protein VirB10
VRRIGENLTQARLLAGSAFARETEVRREPGVHAASGSEVAATAFPVAVDVGSSGMFDSLSGKTKVSDPSAPEGSITPLLTSSPIALAHAKALPTRRFLLAKGAFIDCTLETAIDSTLPGMTTCITATDTFGADGTVVLMERGTKLIGETRGQVQQGMARVFVLWTEARTPTGVVVPLDSPGTDELGRSGLQGHVNRHFWERFGAAILISTLDGVVQAAVQSASRSGGPIIYNPSGTANVLTDVLKNSANIPPTISKANGDRIQVFVARDVDFRSVYELQAVGTP